MNATDITNVVSKWERQYAPKNLARTEHNLNVLKTAINTHVQQNNRLRIEDMVQITNSLGDLDNGGSLQYIKPVTQAAAQPPEPEFNPAENLPHPNEPRLKNIRTMDDLNDLTTDQLRVFTQPVAFDTGLHQKFNERATFIRQHKLRRAKVEETPAKPKTKAQTMEEAIYAKIDGLKGYSDFIIKFKKSLKQRAWEMMHKEDKSLEETDRYVSARIREMENGSIR